MWPTLTVYKIHHMQYYRAVGILILMIITADYGWQTVWRDDNWCLMTSVEGWWCHKRQMMNVLNDLTISLVLWIFLFHSFQLSAAFFPFYSNGKLFFSHHFLFVFFICCLLPLFRLQFYSWFFFSSVSTCNTIKRPKRNRMKTKRNDTKRTLKLNIIFFFFSLFSFFLSR